MKVNKTKQATRNGTQDGWSGAVLLTARYLDTPGRADTMLDAVREGMSPEDAARCQNLFYKVLKNLSLLQFGLDFLCKNRPPAKATALLMVSGAELLDCGEDAGRRARVTDYGVRRAAEELPAKMRGFVNAVLRRLPDALKKAPAALKTKAGRMALEFSHPEWLVRRWLEEFGEANCRALLDWNQGTPGVFVRCESDAGLPECLKATRWPGFYEYAGEHGKWAEVRRLLDARAAYAQDPSTRLCIELLDPKADLRLLELCAAPGGKARHILSRTGAAGTLVCVDLPGERCERLRENLKKPDGQPSATVLERDIFELCDTVFAAAALPCSYDAVLLDAPCSNTGVLRRRPDARWRLREGDIEAAAQLQARLLEKAAEFVAPGGRLVYSTCSIEKAENEALVRAFLDKHPEFSLRNSVQAFPWVDGHDGAAAFAMEKSGTAS